MAPALRIVLETGALRDGRATAGIGRYVRGLAPALEGRPDVTVRTSCTPVAPRPDTWAVRWAAAQAPLLAAAWGSHAHLVHVTGSDPAAGWPLHRQVVTVHDAVPWSDAGAAMRRGSSGPWFAWQRHRFARAGAVIAPSEAAASQARDVLRVPAERVHVVPEGVGAPFDARPAPGDDGRRATALRAGGMGAAADAPYMVWTGNLSVVDPRKGLDVLLGALDALHRRGETAPALLCVGRTGAGADALRAAARGRGLAVHCTGWVDDDTLAALLRGATAVVIPSRHEGFGLPLLEAMACGVPVVATDGGNLRDLAGAAAVVVPAGDAAGLADGIARVVGDTVLRERLRGDGPRRAAAFSWEGAAEATVAVYREAARNARRGGHARQSGE